MPGIENFAPERTETSSGFLRRPSFAPAAFSSLREVRRSSRVSIVGGSLLPVLVVEVAGVGRDREARRHRQAGVGHLGEAGALAAEQCPSSCGRRRPCRRRRSRRTSPAALRRFGAVFFAGLLRRPLRRRAGRTAVFFAVFFLAMLSSAIVVCDSASILSAGTISEMSASSRMRSRSDVIRRKPRLPQRRVVDHHEDVGEEPVDRGTEPAASAKACR